MDDLNNQEQPLTEEQLWLAMFGEGIPNEAVAQELAQEQEIEPEPTPLNDDIPPEVMPESQPEPMPSNMSNETMQELIEAIRENAANQEALTRGLTTSQENMLSALLNPQAPEDEMSDDEKYIRDTFKALVDPIANENKELKSKLDKLEAAEAQRTQHAFVSAMTTKYPDFNPEAVAQEMMNEAERIGRQYMQEGMPLDEAAKRAEQAVRDIWDNEQGIERLHLLLQARNGVQAPPVEQAQEPAQRKPDKHITGVASTPTSLTWKDRLNSEDENERLLVFNDLFR